MPAPTTQPPVNGAIPTTAPAPLAPLDTTPFQPPTTIGLPTIPPRNSPSTQPARTTTSGPCQTTTTGSPPSLPAGVTTTTAKKPPGC